LQQPDLKPLQTIEQNMVDPMDDIARQARQGSVAAIIQVLNEKLATSGVRTRAVLADGVLQLLCEAVSADRLDRSLLVDRIRTLLESLAPRNIRRVNINSRLVREQQLLWLEEISRDPENQLLWSEEITLKKPNILRRFVEDLQIDRASRSKSGLRKTPSERQLRERRQFQRGIVGGIAASLFLLLAFAIVSQTQWFEQFRGQPAESPQPDVTASPEVEAPDAFARAVRLAEQASAEGKQAETRSDWLVIAAKWQQASDLMASVPADHPRYETAQNRTELYRRYSETAQEEARKLPEQ